MLRPGCFGDVSGTARLGTMAPVACGRRAGHWTEEVGPVLRRTLTATVALLVAALVAACGDPTPAEPPADPETSLHLPEGRGRVPLVVLVPGGGWVTADPAGLLGLAEGLAAAGVAAAPAHIRAAEDGVVHPVPVEDVLCEVASAAAEARAQGFDPDPVVVLGHSSGAHLAALAVLAFHDYAPSCDHPAVTPDGLVGISGPYDISRLPGVAAALLGTGPEEDPQGWADANPVERAGLRPGVPVLLVHGSADDVVPADFTSEFARALRRGGHPTTVELVPGADHHSIYGADVAGPLVARWLVSWSPPAPAA